MEGAAQKKPPTNVKKTPSVKSEHETQTAVAVRVPSLKLKPPQSNEYSSAAERIVTPEQIQTASMARKRRMITKKAQGVRTREKTPEPSSRSMHHDDTTTTDEEDPRTPKSPGEIEADRIYDEMKKKIQQKVTEKDDDDLDIDAIREAHAEQQRERRRRSVSPFALPTKEELEGLQRKGSFIDSGNKLLSTIPSYPITFKDEFDPLIRKNSIINLVDEAPKTDTLSVTPSPRSPDQHKEVFQLSTPPCPRKGHEPDSQTEKAAVLPQIAKNITNQEKLPKSLPNNQDSVTVKPNKPNLKPSSTFTVMKPTKKDTPQDNPPAKEEPPIRPKRSKSGTRSQGRTSESEMSEDQNKPKVESQPQKKPRERRRTIAAIKLSVRERSPAVRSKSVTRPEKPLDVDGIELTKTSSDIIELLQKANRKSLSMPDDDLKTSIVNRTPVDSSHQLMTPKRHPSTPKRIRSISCPKTIKILSPEETLESFKQAQRKSAEIERRSRQSSGYVDASQSEVTSSCYSSSYSEDESDFDLSKKSAELTKKLSLLHLEKEREKNKKDDEIKKITKTAEEEKPATANDLEEESKMSTVRLMLKNSRKVWRVFKVEQQKEYEKIRLLRNRCFSDLMILIMLCGFGGVIFRYTEGAFENFYKCGVKRVKRDFIDSLWQTSHNQREDDWKSNARKRLWEFETQLHTAHEAGVHSYSGQKAWSFMNSVVYCLTVVTTIGYGHIAPSTTTGRALTIVYAIIGIPLFLILLADFGKLFTRSIKFLWAFVRRVYYTGSCRKVRRTVQVQEVMKGLNMVYTAASTFRRPSQMIIDEENGVVVQPALPPKASPNLLTVPTKDGSKQEANEDGVVEDPQDPQTPAPSVFEIDDEFNLPISVAIVCWIIYIFMGACIYVVWEEWSFFESFYFVFISMSTIGFGDFVPNHPIYMMGSIVYLVFGMALTSMCINVVQVKLSDSFRQASAKIGATIGLRVSDEDGSLAPITPPPVEIPAVHGANKNDTPANV